LLAAGLCAAQAAPQPATEEKDANPPVQQSAANPGQPPPQQTHPASSAASPSPDKTNSQDVQKQEQTGTSNDRLFYTLPDFLTVETENVPPLSTKQKFGVVARGSFDPVIYPWYAFLSGISQAENSEPGYGQGAAGYGKRFGAAFADGTIENFLAGAILPSVLRQDPRFYQSGKGGFWHRTGATPSTGSLLPAPIPGTSSSTSLRSSVVPLRPASPHIATIRERIGTCPMPRVSGGLRLPTTP
jgi:hypothetical protein